MNLQPENIALLDRIEYGLRLASDKFLEERANNNDTVVISVNGVPQNVPAKDILEKRSEAKRSC